MKTETLYRPNNDQAIFNIKGHPGYDPVEVHVGEYFKATVRNDLGPDIGGGFQVDYEKVTHVLPNHIPDSGKMVEKVQELEKQLESECEDIHKAIEILDGNESPIDWRKGGSELLRKLCEHLEFFHETESELEEARKNAVVWQFGGQGKTLGWKVEELGNGMLRVQGGFTHCTIPLPPQRDEAEEWFEQEWHPSKYASEYSSAKELAIKAYNAAKEKSK